MLAAMTGREKREGATMKIRRHQRRWLVVMAFCLMVASVLVGQAPAGPVNPDGTWPFAEGSAQQPMGPGEENLRAIEQRAHGVGVADDALFRGTARPDWWNYELIPTQSAYEIPSVPDSRADHRTFGGGVTATPVAVDDGSEFSWRDAGFGALGAMALLALMAALAIVIRRDRHRGGLATS
jgi:hypothetical protein